MKRRFSPVLLIEVMIFFDITGYGIVIPLLPFYANYFQAGSTALGLLFASSSLVQFVFAPMLGKVSDGLGRKPILLLSTLFSASSFILFSLANSFLFLLVSRVVSGVASETVMAEAYIADISGEEERTARIGRIGAANGVGFVVGPLISSFLSVYGFAVPGFAAAALAFLNFLFVLFFLPESRDRDARGNVQFKVGEGAAYLRRFFQPFLRPLVGTALAVSFLATMAFAALPVILPLLAIAYYGFNAVEMSYTFIFLGVVQIVVQGFFIKKLTKSFGEERLITFGPLSMLLGILLPLIPSIAVFLASIVFLALGSGIIQTVVPGLISKKSPLTEQGEMLGAAQSVSSIAFVPGPLIGGLAYELAGTASPFILSAAMLAVTFTLSCRVFQACRR